MLLCGGDKGEATAVLPKQCIHLNNSVMAGVSWTDVLGEETESLLVGFCSLVFSLDAFLTLISFFFLSIFGLKEKTD